MNYDIILAGSCTQSGCNLLAYEGYLVNIAGQVPNIIVVVGLIQEFAGMNIGFEAGHDMVTGAGRRG